MARRRRAPFYISTAIPYVNARPHIGFAFEAVFTDSIARYHRQRGHDVFFLSGTDDNSLKNVRAAQEKGVSVAELVRDNAERFYRLKDPLALSFDDFIRTSSDARHAAGVRKLWNACAANGDIYPADYSGLYCVDCEQFYAAEELVQGLCPEHRRPLERVAEKNYFFRLGRYRTALLQLIESDRLHIAPPARRTEILRFIRAGLDDFSVSRSVERAHGWGLPVPGDGNQVVYVWFDALANYITALDYAGDAISFRRYWDDCPARVHVVGKGILRFHAAYWPAMLLSAGLKLPSTIFVHGYLTQGRRKISKSWGDAADPVAIAQRYGTDALRYYLLSRFRASDDGDFSLTELEEVRIKDLADQLGNLVARLSAMIARYREGRVPAPGAMLAEDVMLLEPAQALSTDVHHAVDQFELDRALERIWFLVRRANKYVVECAPWVLARSDDRPDSERLSSVLYNLAETTRLVALFSSAFLPETASRVARSLHLPDGWNLITPENCRWGRLQPGTPVQIPAQLFPKR